MQEKYFLENKKYDIRFNKRSKHFSLIIGKKGEAFIFLTLTHTDKYKKNYILNTLDKVLIDLFVIDPYLKRKAIREAKERKLQQENENKNEQNKDKEYAKELERER